MTDLTLLGALPCETCGGSGVVPLIDPNGEPNPKFCPSCHGLGFVPDPATLETMAEAIAGLIPYDLIDWSARIDQMARAVWEALIRPLAEGE